MHSLRRVLIFYVVELYILNALQVEGLGALVPSNSLGAQE
jgi:hypothetical protein